MSQVAIDKTIEGTRVARFPFATLRVRLLVLVLLAILPIAGLILYTGWENRRNAASEARIDALRLTELAASNQAALIEGAGQLLPALAQLREVRDSDMRACDALFADMLE